MQCGKTQSMAVYMMWVTIFFEDSTSGFTSFKGSNIKDFIRRCQAVYEFLPDWLKPPVTRFNTTEIAFTNNSMLYGEVSGETALRGKTITGAGIATLDELAFVPDADEMLTSLLPSLEAAGSEANTKVIVISTPNTSIGTYAELVNGAIDGSNGWTYYKVDPTLIPNRGEEWRKGMIRKMGRNRYLQEFEGHFLSDNSGLINSSILEAIEHKDPVEEIGDLRLFVSALKGRKVCISVDVSEGVGKDNHCFQIIDIDSLEQVGEFANNTMNQTQYFRKIVKTVHLLYDRGVDIDMSYLGIESNGMGNGILRLYESSTDDLIHRLQMVNDVNQQGVPTGKIGLTTTNPKKIDACGTLKDLVEEGKITMYSQPLLNELRRFTKQGATFKAERGAKDDRVMAMVICMTMLKQIANSEEGVFDVINEVSLEADDAMPDIYF